MDNPPTIIYTDLKRIISDEMIIYGSPSNLLKHVAFLSGGGLNTCVVDGVKLEVNAIYSDGTERVYSTFNDNALSGRLAWVRGSFPGEGDPSLKLPSNFKPSEFISKRQTVPIPGTFLRAILSRFGIIMSFSRYHVDDQLPMALIQLIIMQYIYQVMLLILHAK